jgi:hypothetical protein
VLAFGFFGIAPNLVTILLDEAQTIPKRVLTLF